MKPCAAYASHGGCLTGAHLCGALRSALRLAGAVALGGMLAGSPAFAAEDPRPIMHEVVDALAYLLPLSFDDDRFVDPSSRGETIQKLRMLEASANKLQAHAQERDAGLRMLSGSFSQAARRMRRYYQGAQPEDARFFLVELTQNCVACHSRLPGEPGYPLAQQLMKRVDTPSLHPRDRAQFQVALRQFNAALESWEELFFESRIEPVELDVEGDIIDYLTVSIRVLNDLKRARRTLGTLLQRNDLPVYMRRHLDRWSNDLDVLGPEVAKPPTLDHARRLFTTASGLSVLPAGRERAVYDLVASGMLHRYIDAFVQRQGEDLAEAYYILGIIEARTGQPRAAVPQMEFHLEAAIYSNPKGDVAKQAYAVLEEYSLLNYGGLMLDQPQEELYRLQALKDLISTSTPQQ